MGKAIKKLIELDAAIAETWEDTGYSDPLNVMTAIRERLEALPPVDAVTVRHGRWIHRTPNNGHTPPYDECDKCGWEEKIGLNFCPNCGADMRKDGEHGKTD